MLRKITYGLALVVFAVGCKSKQSKDNVESVPMGSGADSVDSQALSFNPQGSDSGAIDGLTTVYFEYDKASLTSENKKKISANAEWMKKNPGVKLQIEGHCDARGSIEYNIALGERRANTVKNFMISQGVGSDRLSTISYGKEKPLVEGDTEAAYSKNRRANFVPLQ